VATAENIARPLFASIRKFANGNGKPRFAYVKINCETLKRGENVSIERADTIEQGEHGPTRHAIQSPLDLRDAMINALARQWARADKLASHTVNGSPLSANE
jgi:hypothetical protein